MTMRIGSEIDPGQSPMEAEAVGMLAMLPERDRESVARLAFMVGLRKILGGESGGVMANPMLPGFSRFGNFQNGNGSQTEHQHETREAESNSLPNEVPQHHQRQQAEKPEQSRVNTTINTEQKPDLRAGFRGMFGKR
ncbi:hypothetical protein D6833_10950 [Candidatus Parcubacteria bacterium]|nr:MAG: hypothetical protein D6833_10950 [Candidatus Parcubacteria bacterium]